MKTTNQNSHTHTHTHTHTHRGKKQRTCMAGTPQQLLSITVGPQLKKIIKEE